MNAVKFVEALYGKPLFEYQKKLLKFMVTLPKNSKVVYGRNRKIYFVVDKGEEV